MRAVWTIALIFVAGFLIATASKNRKYPRFLKHRTKLREIRGFKPEYISTAIGFGKRDPVRALNLSKSEKILLPLLRDLSRDVSTELLFRGMQLNPESINENDQSNKESMILMDHLKPKRTIALF